MRRMNWKRMGKIENIPAWQLTNVRNKEEVIEEGLQGCPGQTADAVSAHTQDKMEDGCTDVTENSKVRMSRYLDTSTETQMAQIMVQYGKPSCSSWTESVRSSWAGQLWERQFVKVLSKYGLEKVPIWECFRYPRKRTILICVCGRYQTGWRETEHESNMEDTNERRWFGRTNIRPRTCLFGLHSKRMSDQQGYCG